jgi:periplasmic mercuric ion binding protein
LDKRIRNLIQIAAKHSSKENKNLCYLLLCNNCKLTTNEISVNILCLILNIIKLIKMKIIKSFTILFFSILSFQFSSAQTAKSETIKVNGNCGMCKKHIEKSAMEAGATAANWDKKTKFLQISYDPAITNSAKIQTAVAGAGYDTPDFKASDSAYDKLEECCQYDRGITLKEKNDKKE